MIFVKVQPENGKSGTMGDVAMTRAGQMHQSVAAVIRSRILAGEIRPGEPIRLGMLAEDLDVSVTPVREALLMLSQDGWLVHEPHRGFQVRRMRPEDIDDVYRVWAFTEGELAASAAVRATPDDVARMLEIDARINALPDGATPEALALNDRFHDIVHDVADSPKLTWFVDAARRVAPFRVADSFQRVPGWVEMNRTQHRPIIDAIGAGDPDEARRRAQHHLETAGRLLVAWLGRLEFWPDARLDEGERA